MPSHPNSDSRSTSSQKLGANMRREDDQHVERRHRAPDLVEALHRDVGPAREVALDRAVEHAEERADAGDEQREHHRDAKTVEQPREQVASAVVGAQDVVAMSAARDSAPSRSN